MLPLKECKFVSIFLSGIQINVIVMKVALDSDPLDEPERHGWDTNTKIQGHLPISFEEEELKITV